jgi:hypothetical protein
MTSGRLRRFLTVIRMLTTIQVIDESIHQSPCEFSWENNQGSREDIRKKKLCPNAQLIWNIVLSHARTTDDVYRKTWAPVVHPFCRCAHTMGVLSALAIVFLAVVETMAQPPAAPVTGYQMGIPPTDSVILPQTMSQCEPFLVYYNTTSFGLNFELFIASADASAIVANITIPNGVGYVDWICNIPAGEGLAILATGNLNFIFYNVGFGSSSACLGDVDETYPLIIYNTTAFESYTEHTYVTIDTSEFSEAGVSYTAPCVFFPNLLLVLTLINH